MPFSLPINNNSKKIFLYVKDGEEWVPAEAGDIGGGGVVTGLLTITGNLSDLSNVASGRLNLGLGSAAVLNTGTGASQVILGNDARLTGSSVTSIVGITGTLTQFNTALTDGDFASLAGTEVLTNKTITAPNIYNANIYNAIIDTPTINGLVGMSSYAASMGDVDILTINESGSIGSESRTPFVTLTGIQTLTNKTLTSPTLTTPVLGTPSSGTLTNCTGLPTAGLVDDAVTLAKMAAGTAGNLITYDASGNPAAVATGTATHVLTSNGAGAAPTFQAAAGGSTNLSYTASTRLLESSTGTDVTLPLFTSTEAGLTPLSGGGTTAFLRADGTWVVPSGSGNVSKVGTPANDQVGVWTGDGTIEGTSGLTYDGTNLSVGAVIVPTISSTSTLTNKTLTSPTLTTPVLGTPSSGTLTNCTGLPAAGLVASTSQAVGFGTIELGHASDTTIARASAGVISVEGVTVPTISSTNTFTNKRFTPRITTITSEGTPTVNTDNCDCVTITAQAAAITSMTTNLTGTPVNFQQLVYRIKDNGTARAITWGASFEACGAALPTTTVLSKRLYIIFIYDTVAAKWGCVSTSQEA